MALYKFLSRPCCRFRSQKRPIMTRSPRLAGEPAGTGVRGSRTMKWQCFVIVGWVAIGSAGAWGQAAAEYGVTASSSAAATAAATDKLKRQSSAAIAAAAANLDRPMSGSAKRATPAPVVTGTSRGQRHSRVQPKPTPVPKSTSTVHPIEISLVGGAVSKQRAPDPKYPGVVDFETPPIPAAKPDKAPPKN